jgi:hypothetical protein
MAPDADGGSKHTLADREYFGSLSPLLLMEFHNYVRGLRGVQADDALLMPRELGLLFRLHHAQRSQISGL